MRKTCLDLVYELARSDDRIFFVGSDLGFGTMKQFKEEMPDRFFMEGVSEANVIGMAAGLALEGKIPYVNTIATFLTRRCFEQIVLDLCLHNLNVSNLIYCGAANLQYSDDAAANWANTPANVANSVCAAPAMVSGFPEGEAFIVGCSATPWVHLSVDFGNSWTDKSGNLSTWLGVGDTIMQIIPVQEGFIT